MNQTEVDKLIYDMCMTYRHDFGLNKEPDDPPWVAGMTHIERQGLIKTMRQIFENNIKPLLNDYKNGDDNDISSKTCD
jgi:hypothetical protein